MCLPIRDVYQHLKSLIKSSPSKLPKQELKNLLPWTETNFLNADSTAVFTRDLWNSVGVKLYNAISLHDKKAADLLPTCCVLVEIFSGKPPLQCPFPPPFHLNPLCHLSSQERVGRRKREKKTPTAAAVREVDQTKSYSISENEGDPIP